MCLPDAPRPGARLEEGAAHAHDHADWSRRDFLKRLGLATAGAGFLAGANPVGVFARAPLLDLLAGLDTDRVLILIQLSGGNDGLNTLVPVDNDVYYSSRIKSGLSIAVPKASALALGASGGQNFGLHPGLAPLQSLWGDGRMGLVHSVGYRSQSRSHFEGSDNWMTGSGSGVRRTDGWVGRFLLDRLAPEETIQFYRENPPAVSLGSATRLFDTDEGNVGIGRLAYTTTTTDLLARGAVFPTDGLPAEPFAAPLKYLREQINVNLAYVVRFVEATTAAKNLVTYPANNGLASNLALAARIVRGGLSPRIITVTLGGFDTHANQGADTGAHANLMTQLAASVRAFFDDLKADGLDQRVVAMTFSEFGRTLASNGSGGTDHGSAAPVMLFGPAVEGGFFGTAPTLTTDLDRAAPGPTTDYRSLYATLLERWFGAAPSDVDALLGPGYDRLGFLSPTATPAEPTDALAATALLAPSPNPFATRTTVRYRLDAPGSVRLAVFDALGRRVATLADGYADAGESHAEFDGSGLAAGLYLVRLETARGVITRPVVRVR